jgi:hypothetical protein
MRSTTLLLIAILILFKLPSCFLIKIDAPSFYSRYEKLDHETKRKVVFISDNKDICNIEDNYKIYSINAYHLLECIKKNDTSVVYKWNPGCIAKSCISLQAAQTYCDSMNYSLYIISDYYDFNKTEPHFGTTEYPIFSINHFHYQTDFTDKYKKLFYKELIRNKKIPKEESYYRFYIFYKDNFINSRRYLIEETGS